MFTCILCNSQEFVIHNICIRKDPNRVYKIYKCIECSHIQLYPNVYDYKSYYENDNQDKDGKSVASRDDVEYSEMLSNFHSRRLNILESKCVLNSETSIIDIGGGNGEFAKLFCEKYNSIVHLLEPRCSRINNVISGSIVKINRLLDSEIASENASKFDIVTAFHVLEHVVDPIQFVSNSFSMVKPGGLLYIEVPNQRDTRQELSDYYKDNIWYCQAHISYFSQHTLKYILDTLKIEKYEFGAFERYDYENEMHWRNNNRPQPNCTYYKKEPTNVSAEESDWLTERRNKLTSDSIYCIIRK